MPSDKDFFTNSFLQDLNPGLQRVTNDSTRILQSSRASVKQVRVIKFWPMHNKDWDKCTPGETSYLKVITFPMTSVVVDSQLSFFQSTYNPL